jgi:hypothetical protein
LREETGLSPKFVTPGTGLKVEASKDATKGESTGCGEKSSCIMLDFKRKKK